VETLRLRAHHLLCLPGFRGLGYSREHAAAMWRAKNRLFGGAPDLAVVLQTHPDEICLACPWLKGGACRWGGRPREAEVALRDCRVLSRLELRCGTAYSPGEIKTRLDGLRREDILALCGNCHWLHAGYCLETFGGGGKCSKSG